MQATKTRRTTKSVKPWDGTIPEQRREWNLKPARSIKEHREGTKRDILVRLLIKGATMQKIMKETEWDYRTACDGIRLLHTQLGYGIKQEGDIIRVLEKKR